MDKKKIAIIGAGYTGMTAAWELARSGFFDVTVIERSEEVGGLASGLKIGGANIEKTYHHIFKSDTYATQTIAELGLTDKLEWRDSSMGLCFEQKTYPFMTPVDLLKFPPLNFWDKIRAGLVILYLQKTSDWKKFINASAFEWMEKWSGQAATNVIWGPLLKNKFDAYYQEISMAWLWARIHIRGNSKNKTLGGEKLGYMTGGFDLLTKGLKSEMDRNHVTTRLNTAVEKVTRNENGKKLALQISGLKEEFDRVLATVPSPVFAGLVSDEIKRDLWYFNQLSQIEYLGVVCAVFSSRQKINDYYWTSINDENAPFLVFINQTRLVDKSRYSGSFVYYLAAYVPHNHRYFGMDEHDLLRSWFAYLKILYPSFTEEEIIEKHLFRLKYAQHITDRNYPSRVPDYRCPISGMYLANFSQLFPEDRGINFAIREGKKVAKIILEDA